MPECPWCKGNITSTREDYVKEVIDHPDLMKMYVAGEWDYEMYCLREGIEMEPLPTVEDQVNDLLQITVEDDDVLSEGTA